MRLTARTAFRKQPVATQLGIVWARRCATVLLAVTVLFAGCDELGIRSEVAKFKFDNRTDSRLCLYLSSQDASSARCLDEIEPQSVVASGSECGSGAPSDLALKAPITVILAVKASGRQIYSRTALCREWNDSGGTFVIEQEGDEFVVTD